MNTGLLSRKAYESISHRLLGCLFVERVCLCELWYESDESALEGDCVRSAAATGSLQQRACGGLMISREEEQGATEDTEDT